MQNYCLLSPTRLSGSSLTLRQSVGRSSPTRRTTHRHLTISGSCSGPAGAEGRRSPACPLRSWWVGTRRAGSHDPASAARRCHYNSARRVWYLPSPSRPRVAVAGHVRLHSSHRCMKATHASHVFEIPCNFGSPKIGDTPGTAGGSDAVKV